MKLKLEQLMTKLQGEPVLVHRPKRVICKVGTYDIIVSSENSLENEEKFNQFCQEFKTILMMMVGQGPKSAELPNDEDKVGPIATNPGVS